MEILKNIETSLAKIRPSLQADGGDVELVGFDESTGILQLRLVGVCAHCPMAEMTLKDGIEAQIREDVPAVKSIERV